VQASNAVVPGRGAFNETTGQYANDDPPLEDVIYQGPCKFQIRADINANIVEPVEVEREWAYQTSTLLDPIDGRSGWSATPGNRCSPTTSAPSSLVVRPRSAGPGVQRPFVVPQVDVVGAQVPCP
jgi:hypothetical protein